MQNMRIKKREDLREKINAELQQETKIYLAQMITLQVYFFLPLLDLMVYDIMNFNVM